MSTRGDPVDRPAVGDLVALCPHVGPGSGPLHWFRFDGPGLRLRHPHTQQELAARWIAVCLACFLDPGPRAPVANVITWSEEDQRTVSISGTSAAGRKVARRHGASAPEPEAS